MWAHLQTIQLLSSAAAMCWLPFLAPYLKLVYFRDLKALKVQMMCGFYGKQIPKDLNVGQKPTLKHLYATNKNAKALFQWILLLSNINIDI